MIFNYLFFVPLLKCLKYSFSKESLRLRQRLGDCQLFFDQLLQQIYQQFKKTKDSVKLDQSWNQNQIIRNTKILPINRGDIKLGQLVLLMGQCVSRQKKQAEKGLLKKQQSPLHTFPQLSPRSAQQLQKLIERRDKKKRALTQDEMYQLVSDYFDLFDGNHDGDITFQQVRNMLSQMQQNYNRKNKDKITIGEEDVHNFFTKLDIYGNGRISKQQFYQFYKQI